MILFFNLFITGKRREGHPNTADTLDIFKYALASYACWDRINEAIIFCELDNDFKHRESEREVTKKQLEKARLKYDKLIMGIGGGVRMLINDKNPQDKIPLFHSILIGIKD